MVRGAARRSLSLLQLVQELAGVAQVADREALAEAAIDEREELAGLGGPALVAEQAGQARGRAQLVDEGTLPARDLQRHPEGRLGPSGVGDSEQQLAAQAVELRVVEGVDLRRRHGQGLVDGRQAL